MPRVYTQNHDGTHKVCKECRQRKSLSDFRQPTGKNYYESYCDKCRGIRYKNWYYNRSEAQKIRDRERKRAYTERSIEVLRDRTRLRRIREYEAFVEYVDVNTLYKRDDGVCGLCGLFVDPQNWHVDHITPLAKGGTHEYTNVQVSHPSCNHRKGARSNWNAWIN